MALDWDQISTVTRDYIVPKLVDNIFNANVVMHSLLSKSKPATGLRIFEPLKYAKGVSDWYSEYDTFTINPKEKLTNAVFPWRQAYASIVISGLEEDVQNVGPEQIFNLIEVEADIAEMTIIDMFSEILFQTSSAGAKEMGNFYDLVYNTTGEVGGIDANSYSWWVSQSKNAAALYGNSGSPSWSDIVTSTNRDFLPSMMRDLWAAVSDSSNDKPSLIITTQLIYDAYEHILGMQKRSSSLAGSKMLADHGFESLLFRGVPVVTDSGCPDGFMFMINEKYFGMRHAKKRKFKFEPFQKPVNQDVRVAKILWAGNVTCSNRRRQGVLYNLPTAV